MKNLKLILGITVFAVTLTSCKNEKQEMAQKKVDSYIVYVDSISAMEANETAQNWDKIQADYEAKKNEAKAALADLENANTVEVNLDDTTLKFEEYKEKVVLTQAEMQKQNFRKSLFGEGIIGQDMSFSWVNKDNIADVYGHFVSTVDENKDSYTREDWDEIKLLYEALDTRKNTVENEGLSSEDNQRIAGLKIKFAPMYALNRMGAKSEENAEAKE